MNPPLRAPGSEGEGGVAAGVIAGSEDACRRVDGEAGEAVDQFGEDDAGLQAGRGSAQAVVRAEGECQMPRPGLLAAQDVEVLSIRAELSRVAVGRPVQQQDL